MGDPYASAFEAVNETAKVTADIEYQHDPIRWMVERLGIPEHTIRWSLNPGYQHHTWDGDQDPFVKVAEALAQGRDVGIESATATGKTHFAHLVALWFLACFDDSLVVTVAPKEAQLTKLLWSELGRSFGKFRERFPEADKGELVVRMRHDADDRDVWSMIGWACGPEANAQSTATAQGFHRPHMLMIYEETPGIPTPTLAALGNSCVGQHNIQFAVGNPNSMDDALHVFCSQPTTTHVRISAYDHPNVVCGRDVIPGATSMKGIERLGARWGYGTPMFKSRAQGICPTEAAQALIKREWCDKAIARYQDLTLRRGKGAKGVDAAQSENGDEAAIADWRGACLLDIRAFACPNATDLGTQVADELERDDVEAWYVGVDPIGVGAATANELDRLCSFGVQKLYASARPYEATQRAPDGREYDWAPDAGAYANLRAQMYWQMREDLRLGLVALPTDPELVQELVSTQYTEKRGKVLIEEKEAIRKRIGRSPNKADAVVMGNWVRHRAKIQPKDETPLNIYGSDVLRAEYERNYRASRVQPQPAAVERHPAEVDPMFGDF